MINPHIVAVGPAQFLQPLLECHEAHLVVLIVRGQRREHADAPHPLGLLRARRKRPRCRCAADERYERAAVHSITSSARAMTVGGTVRPRLLAILTLISNSKVVGCCMGKSVGFAPL